MKVIKMKRVLAGIDFSDWTSPVLQTAVEIARIYEARLTVVYAEMFLPPPYFTQGAIEQIADFLDKQKEAARDYLQETMQRPVRIQTAVGYDQTMYRVQVGPMRNVEQADATSMRLAQLGIRDMRLIIE